MWRVIKSASLRGSFLAIRRLLLVAVMLPAIQGLKGETITAADSEIEAAGSRQQVLETENAKLSEQVDLLKRSASAWGDNAAEANAEAEVFRRQYDTLKLRIEALGITSVAGRNEPIEQRLLKSVRDLDLMRQQKEALHEQLLALSEAVFRYLKTTDGDEEPHSRSSVEAELRITNELLGKPSRTIPDADAVPATLRGGLVLGCKEELALLVANFGRQQGAKVGMLLTVARGDTYVGHARIVQIRDRISGALIEETAEKIGKVKVGDQLRVDAL